MGSPDYYRQKAANLRQTAASIKDSHIKDEYLKMAYHYDALAEEAERWHRAREN